MYNKKSISDELSNINVLKDLVNVYEELAANNMRKVRNTVIKKRDFLSEITQIYNEVRNTYKKELMHLRKQKKIKDQSFFALLKKNGKTVYVFLSTNTSLYGTIVKDTYKLFREHMINQEADIVIIGKFGKSIFDTDYPGKQYTYFDFPDGEANDQELKNILLHILPYEKVIIFHSKFESIVSQKSVAFILSGDETEEAYAGNKIKYIFEPALDKIVTFFEQEIFASIFEQVIHESDLSKFASRMTLLDKTLENIKLETSKLQQQQRILRHQAMNKEQQNTLSSRSLWRKR